MTTPKHYPDAATTQIYPIKAANVDNSSTDVDLSALYVQGYARRLRCAVGGTVKVDLVGSTGVTYTVIAGQRLDGCFTKLYHTGSSVQAATFVAEE